MTIEQRSEFLDFSLALAQASEKEIMPRYRNCLANHKSDGSDVTVADLSTEIVMRQMIAGRFPDHDVLGEELGAPSDLQRQYQWILDPLDGTTWFVLGVPIFGTLVALLEGNEPVLGVIHLPAMGETVYAARGLGCWFKARGAAPVRVRVGSPASLEEATVSAAGVHGSDIYLGDGKVPYNLTALIHRARRFRFCGDCLQHALVCRGKIHAAVDTIMQPWDTAAIIPCIEEAGGVATTISDRQDDIAHGGSLVTSCDASLQREVIEVLQTKEAHGITLP